MSSIARVLFTGSRGWPDPRLLGVVLMDVWHDAVQLGYDGILLVHGDADGADTDCQAWADLHGVSTERHPADWGGPCGEGCRPGHRRRRRDGTEYCPQAGHRRNQHMVDLGAGLAVGFHYKNSSGTADCLRRAAAAKIPVRRVTPSTWVAQQREVINSRDL